MTRFVLEHEAQVFASQLTTLLNQTVCNGTVITFTAQRNSAVVKVGYKLKADDYRLNPIPLKLNRRRPSGYMGLLFSLCADAEGKYLTVQSSVMTYGFDNDTEHPILHYDYERDKADGYPDAHLQVTAAPETWPQICQARRMVDRPFGRMHLPVGPRRFRPTLEDLITFLVVEGLADAKPGWRAAVDEGQERFAVAQLSAAVRRRPEVARAALEEYDRSCR